MKLVILLLVLALRRMDIHWPQWLAEHDRIGRVAGPIGARTESAGLAEELAWLVRVALPALLVALVFALMHGWLLTLLGMALGTALLLWLLGPESEFRTVDDLLVRGRMNDGDQLAALAAERFDATGTPDDDGYFDRLIYTILHRETRRLFASVFYLITLGYWAAVLYVLNCWLASRRLPGSDTARWVDVALFWLPSRLLVVVMALAGDFRRVMDAVGDKLWALEEGDSMLAQSLEAAMHIPVEDSDTLQAGVDRLDAMQSVLQRCLAIWLIMAAVWVVLVG
ncbi:MAG: hypothetical protein ACPG43_05435 [Alcanivoracaceae bacterium]